MNSSEKKKRDQARRNVRLALLLGFLAIGFYVAFIVARGFSV